MKTKRFVSALLALLLICSLPVSAFADTVPDCQAGDTATVDVGNTMKNNYGTVTDNYGEVSNNWSGDPNNVAKVENNYGTVTTNGSAAEKRDAKVDNNYGTVTTNNGAVTNNGTETNNDKAIVTTNNWYVENNYGTVTDNYEIVQHNYGTVKTNNGTEGDYAEVRMNYGTITTNEGIVFYNGNETNHEKAIVETNNRSVGTNNGTVKINKGTVGTNNGIVETNKGTVGTNINNGIVETNKGTVDINGETSTVSTNEGTVTKNDGTVTTNEITGTVSNRSGTVKTNYGTVNKLKYDSSVGDWVITETHYGVLVDNDGTTALEQKESGQAVDFSHLTKEGYVYAGYTQAYGMENGKVTLLPSPITVNSTSYTVTCPNVLTLIWQAIFSPGSGENTAAAGETAAAADDGAGYFGPGSHIAINGHKFLLVAVVEDVYCLASVDSFEDEELSDLPALLASLLTEEQLTHVTGEPELLDEALTARFFAGQGSHIVFPCDSSLIFS